VVTPPPSPFTCAAAATTTTTNLWLFHIVDLCVLDIYLLFTFDFCLTRIFNQNRLPEKDQESSVVASLVSSLTCSAALPDTGMQDTDTDIVTTDMSRPGNGFAMLRRVINWRIYYYYCSYFTAQGISDTKGQEKNS